MQKKRLLIMILLLALVMTLSQLNGEVILYSMSQIPWWLALLLFGLQIVTQLVLNLQWYIIAKMANLSLSFWDMFRVNCQGAVMDGITPGVKLGGEVTRAIQISRTANCSGEQSATVVALQKLFSISGLLILLLFSIGYLIGEVPWLATRYTQVLVYGFLVLFLMLFFGLFLFSQGLKKRIQVKKDFRFSWQYRLQCFLLTLLNLVEAMGKKRNVCITLAVLSFFLWFMYPAKMYVLALQYQSEVHVIQLMSITFAAYLVAMLPLFPGGLGGFEGVMSGLLVGAGFMVSDAAVITIFFRFVTFWFVMLFSFGFVTLRKINESRT